DYDRGRDRKYGGRSRGRDSRDRGRGRRDDRDRGSRYDRDRSPRRAFGPGGKPSGNWGGDWVCEKCDCNNFARRDECFKCGAKKPSS
ncbi:unnamed protein product, partial [Symbiodinium pilosum]